MSQPFGRSAPKLLLWIVALATLLVGVAVAPQPQAFAQTGKSSVATAAGGMNYLLSASTGVTSPTSLLSGAISFQAPPLTTNPVRALIPRSTDLMDGGGQRIPDDVPIRSTRNLKGFNPVRSSVGGGRVQVGGFGGQNVLEQVVNFTQLETADDIHPYWTQDEQFIFFASNRASNGTYQIFRVRANESRNPANPNNVGGVVTPANQLTADPTSNFFYPALNANGNQIVLTRSNSAVEGGRNHLYYASFNGDGTINLTVGSGGGLTSLTANRTTAPFFDEVQKGQFLAAGVIVFSARLRGETQFHLFTVNLSDNVFTQITSGTASELNPAPGPSGNTGQSIGLIAFDTNASIAPGGGYQGRGSALDPAIYSGVPQARRNIFLLASTDLSGLPPQPFTTIPNTDNIEPAWSSTTANSRSNPAGNSVFLAFASNRRDVRNIADPTVITQFVPGNTYDIYYLRAFDPSANADSLGVEVAPGDATTFLENVAQKLNTGDPNYRFNDRYPTWAQFIRLLSICHQSDRTGSYQRQAGSPTEVNQINPFRPTPTQNDLFISTVVDITAPSLIRYEENQPRGEVVHINIGTTFNAAGSRRTAEEGLTPGQNAFFSVRVEDRESGLAPEYNANDPNNNRGAVFLQFKNPNSKYQQGSGLEHKEWQHFENFSSVNPVLDGPLNPAEFYIDWAQNTYFGHEYECQAISAADRISYFSHNNTRNLNNGGATSVPAPAIGTQVLYTPSVDDADAFSGFAHPPLIGGTFDVPNATGTGVTPITTENVYLRLNRLPESQQDGRGGILYGATWQIPDQGSDWYIDVIAYDNSVNPFNTIQRSNWIIYDNVWGFSSRQFATDPNSASILFVSDYALGQKFLTTRQTQTINTPGGVPVASNQLSAYYGSESYLTDIAAERQPVQIAPTAPMSPPRQFLQSAPFNVAVQIVGGAFGIWNFGQPNALGVRAYVDEYLFDGSPNEADGSPTNRSNRYEIWRTLCRGQIPVSVLENYRPTNVQTTAPDIAVGETTPRRVTPVNRMIIWSSPLVGNLFTGTGTIIDSQIQGRLGDFVRGGGRLFVTGQDIARALSAVGGGGNDFLNNVLRARFVTDGVNANGVVPVAAAGIDNLPAPPGVNTFPGPEDVPAFGRRISNDAWVGAQHAYGRHNGTIFIYDPPIASAILGITNLTVGTQSPLFRSDASLASPVDGSTDVIAPIAAFTDAFSPYLQMNYDTGQGAMIASQFAGGGRTIFAGFGLESMSQEFYEVSIGMQPFVVPLGRRQEIMHNIICVSRTGVLTGVVQNSSQGGSNLDDVLIRAYPLYIQGPDGIAFQTTALNTAAPATYTSATDGSGTYQLEGLDPGAYIVTAFRRGFAQTTLARATINSVHGGGSRTVVNISMTETEPGNIRGRVLRGDGTTGQPGIEVQARALAPEPDGSLRFDVGRGVSGPDGTYDIAGLNSAQGAVNPGVPAGLYELVANPIGIIDVTGDDNVTEADLADVNNRQDVNGDGQVNVADITDPRNNRNYNRAFDTVFARDPNQANLIVGAGTVFLNGQVQVNANATTNISFILSAPPQDVTGAVYAATFNGVPERDASGNLVPIAGATVVATRTDRNNTVVAVGTATTAADGTYRFDDVPEDQITLVVTALGFQPSGPILITTTGGATPLVVPNIFLNRLPPGSIIGAVQDAATGRYVSGVAVSLYAIRAGVVDLSAPTQTTTTGDRQQTNDNPAFVFNYSFADVPPGDYQIRAVAAGQRTDPISYNITVTTGQQTRVSPFRLTPPRIFGRGVQLISTPADYSNIDPRAIFNLTATGDNNGNGISGEATDIAIFNQFTVADWTGTNYDIAPNTRLQVGRGYFVRFLEIASVQAQGAIIGNELSRDLPEGWSLIGHPFYDFNNIASIADIDLTNVAQFVVTDVTGARGPAGATYNINQAAALGLVRNVVFSFTGSLQGAQYVQQTALRPFNGYWFRAFSPVRITFLRVPTRSVQTVVKSRAMTIAEADATRQREIVTRNIGDWRLQLAAKQGDLLDTDNTLGVAPGAKEGFDYLFDTEKPAQVTETPTVYVSFAAKDDKGRAAPFADDIRAATSGTKTWSFSVNATGTGDVTLFWPNLNRVPRNLNPILVDEATGRRYPMRSRSSFQFTPVSGTRAEQAHRFRVEVAPPQTQPLDILNLRSTPIQGGNGRKVGGGYRFSFTTTQEADVQIELTTVSGRTMRRFATRSRAAEEAAIVWDGKDERGSFIPAGGYALRVTARDSAGNIARRQVQMINIR